MLDQDLIKIVPAERQIKHQQLEFYAFIHFTVNTFTGEEWGKGTESPSIFNPLELDAEQWVTSIKAAHMKGILLTCKHHDGFCLWPSKYTEHSVKSSPYKNGQGDIVKELADACKKHDMKFGIYLSPWDRNNETYGYGKVYDDYFLNQLTELLTNYGDIFTVWFDGACGEGTNGKKQVYDWPRYYEKIRSLMPKACISICGNDIRWCGNEAGDTRESEWSVVPKSLALAETIAERSQQVDDKEFRKINISSHDKDLGSRKALAHETDLIWYPAEVDTSIRPGWFYHEKEDQKVRPLEKLIDIYYKSVGGNSMLLLNIPPDKRGLLHENDVQRLKEIGDYITNAFSNEHKIKSIASDYDDGENVITNVLKDDLDTYFKTKDGQVSAKIDIKLEKPSTIKHIILKENIRLSQRIETFEISCFFEDKIVNTYAGTIVGYKKIIKVPEILADSVQIKITDSRISPTLAYIGVY